MKLVVDANIFISALIGGKASEFLFNPNFDLLTMERTTWEVKNTLYAIPEKNIHLHALLHSNIEFQPSLIITA